MAFSPRKSSRHCHQCRQPHDSLGTRTLVREACWLRWSNEEYRFVILCCEALFCHFSFNLATPLLKPSFHNIWPHPTPPHSMPPTLFLVPGLVGSAEAFPVTTSPLRASVGLSHSSELPSGYGQPSPSLFSLLYCIIENEVFVTTSVRSVQDEDHQQPVIDGGGAHGAPLLPENL